MVRIEHIGDELCRDKSCRPGLVVLFNRSGVSRLERLRRVVRSVAMYRYDIIDFNCQHVCHVWIGDGFHSPSVGSIVLTIVAVLSMLFVALLMWAMWRTL